jgi:hypothetical protein
MKPNLSEAGIVRALAEQVAQRMTRKTITALCGRTETTSGDDSGLKTVWDEICVQVQYEESILWDAYDLTVRSFIEAYVEDLQPHEQSALWLQTDQGCGWACEEPDDRDDDPVFNSDIVDYVVKDYVYIEAGRWSNRRIRAFIDQAGMRD